MGRLNKRLLIILIILIVCFFGAIPLLYFGYNYKINSKVLFVGVPFANLTIQSGTQISSAMISINYVPKSFLVGEYYEYPEEIVGKCVNDDTVIINGSIFYDDLLVECQVND